METPDNMNTPAPELSPDSALHIDTLVQDTPLAPSPTPKAAADHQTQDAQTETMPQAADALVNNRLLLAVQVLEDEVKELHNLLSDSVTLNLNRRIELIRGLVEETNQNLNSTGDDGKEAESKSQRQTKSDDKKSDQEEDDMVCAVRRSSMKDWSKEQPHPEHVIAAHYLPSSLIDTTDELKGAGMGIADRQERPQRVELASGILIHELEDIADINLETQPSMLLAPPYKILIKYYDGICERLSFLESNIPQESKKSEDLHRPASFPLQETTTSTSDTSEAESPRDTNRQTSESNADSEPVETNDDEAGGEDEDTPVKRKAWITRLDHLRLLKNFIDTDLAPQLRTFTKAKTGELETTAFEDLWFLFTPGDMIYFKERGYDRLGKVYALTGGQQQKRRREATDPFAGDSKHKESEGYRIDSTRGSWSSLTVNYYTMEYDGYYLGPKDACKHIRHYTGERSITDLPIFPLKFHEKKDEIERRLKKRGERYCSSYGHKSYNGTTCPSDDKETPEERSGDMFVDFKDYYRIIADWPANETPPRPHYRQGRPRLGNLIPIESDPSEVEEKISGNVTFNLYDREVDYKSFEDFVISYMTQYETLKIELDCIPEDRLLLLPHWVPAYFFRSRHYERVDVEEIQDIDKSDKARDSSFENLIIPDSHRNLLLGLVRNLVVRPKPDFGPQHVGGTSTQIDLVRGKGHGLIILLHGPPGSGKTSTAETLAAYSGRPLYPITCGDLGTDPGAVEKALVEHTERAQRWGCVLLLDEADVFLSRRNWRDTNHNALVSVFLRQLEYYSGILFLTTNRVGVIDEAFKSRIHVSLAYPTLKLKETLDIWGGILSRIERDNQTASIRVKFNRTALLGFARRHYNTHEKTNSAWNGRQIRNAFQLAISLGHYDRDKRLGDAKLTEEEAMASGDKKWTSVKLTTANFNDIAITARDFEDYIQHTRGNDSEIAKTMSLRYDYETEELVGSSPFIGVQKDYREQSRAYLTPEHRSRGRVPARSSAGYDPGVSHSNNPPESPLESRRRTRNQEVRDRPDSNEQVEEDDEDDFSDDISSD
ncbi:hypothetical protein FSARC_11107 [Fusarium sarcochroum]|uniref:AAA+ ATPase domain-containing protein n=1 Tax=Fusarium sarcochroum TaxID=1208366 RepID=A0A8H4THN0_9HYPO|nr:hypothetical protein FSARC_11107 [Fusarium sarcochroum]